ncbi:hypothetical protein CHS0354_035950 [Potamilus streckersoni]|uniref:G-protein coupled receptors family 1 profile domain-containing protein n=1 Tax=Potamilus streckersoni TaxID=2493646 RepID=A0AAE0TGQ8_9BIVA|nr:hypothetical protein CHS0354_035950 [Potamilus streckersoni]
MSDVNNSSLHETLDNLNTRYASALLPLSIIFGFLAFAGLVGNTIVLLVFSLSHEYNKSNFKVFALFLGIIDLVTCITIIPAEIAKHRHYFAFENGAVCKVKCFLNVFGSGASALTLLLISVERFRRVCKPFSVQIRTRLVIRLCFVLLLFALLLACPAAVMCGIEEASMKNFQGRPTKVYVCAADERYRFSVWRPIYKVSIAILLGVVSATCIVMYIFVGRTIIKTRGRRLGFDSFRIRGKKVEEDADLKINKVTEGQNDIEPKGPEAIKETNPRRSSTVSRIINITRRKLSSQSTDSERIGRFPYKTIIWFVLTIIFIVSYAVYVALSFNPYVIIGLSPRLFTLYSFFFRLYIINSVINPLIYALLDSRFRRSCKRLLLERLSLQ